MRRSSGVVAGLVLLAMSGCGAYNVSSPQQGGNGGTQSHYYNDRSRSGDNADRNSDGSGSGPVGQSSSATGSAAMSGSLALYVWPGPGDAPVVQLIQGARKSIDFEMYEASDRGVLAALAQAAGRGVKVRAILEPSPYKARGFNQGAYDELSAAGAAVEWDKEPVRLDHAKYMVVDGQTAEVGTENFTYSGFNRNREYAVVTSDQQTVSVLEALFAADFAGGNPPAVPAGIVVAPINADASLTGLISSAKHTILIEDEELYDPSVVDELAQKEQAGVQVQVVLPSSEARWSSDFAALGSVVHYLQAPYIHAKAIVVDGATAFVGSENLSTSSLDDNREVGLIVSDPAVVKGLASTVAGDWDQGQ